MINISKPFLPSKKEYQAKISEIFQRNWLTNQGPLVKELEATLIEYLEVENLQYVTNGTTALQLAIRALDLRGEVITTPFSYVATTSSIVWEHCEPVFADIDKDTFNIDPSIIEALITPKTSAIVATHVFGNPCNVVEIQRIAEKHDLRVIYDAAHAFGVQINDKSILLSGTISTLSFHATKMFHTVEGGAVITNEKALNEKVGYLKNFGHDGYEAFHGLGINGKNSEFHAAMGLCNLKHFESIRKKYFLLYQEYLANLKKVSKLRFQKIESTCHYNYAYFPVVFRSEMDLLNAKEKLEEHGIFPRRYFYPSLSKLPYVRKSLVPNSEQISESIMCLPMFYDLSVSEVSKICSILKNALKDE